MVIMEMTLEERNALLWEPYRELVPRNVEPSSTKEIALRDEIITAYLYLAKLVVGKMKKTLPGHVERDDLESWAKIGLMQAVSRYDNTISVPFEAYATQRMRSVIMDGIRDADWAPRSLRKKQRDIAKLEEIFRQSEGREPTLEELAVKITWDNFDEFVSEDDFRLEVIKVMEEISNTKYQAEISSHTYIEGSIEAQNKPVSISDEEDELVFVLKTTVGKTVEAMSIRKAVIIALHYYGEKKLSEIAELLNMSEVRVGLLHSEAVLEIWERIQSVLADD